MQLQMTENNLLLVNNSYHQYSKIAATAIHNVDEVRYG